MIRHTKHAFRASFLIIAGGVAFFVARALLLPPTFGDFGHYRGSNVAEQMQKKPRFSEKSATLLPR